MYYSNLILVPVLHETSISRWKLDSPSPQWNNISRIMQGTQRFDENMHIKIHRSEASLHIKLFFKSLWLFPSERPSSDKLFWFFFLELTKAKRSLQITLSVRLFQQFAKHLPLLLIQKNGISLLGLWAGNLAFRKWCYSSYISKIGKLKTQKLSREGEFLHMFSFLTLDFPHPTFN